MCKFHVHNLHMNLLTWRKMHNVTRAQLSARTGISVSQLSRIERGLSRPRRDAAQKIALATAGAVAVAEPGRSSEVGVQEDALQFRYEAEGRPAHDVLAEARALGLDADAIARMAVETAVRRAKASAWVEENRAALAAHARDVEEHGLWSDGLRLF